jgi:hypothetical protein
VALPSAAQGTERPPPPPLRAPREGPCDREDAGVPRRHEMSSAGYFWSVHLVLRESHYNLGGFMRYVWGLLASLLICSPAQAASLDFAFDVIFNGQAFLDVGRISIPAPAAGFTGLIEDITSPFTFSIPGIVNPTAGPGFCQGASPADCTRSFFVSPRSGRTSFIGFDGAGDVLFSNRVVLLTSNGVTVFDFPADGNPGGFGFPAGEFVGSGTVSARNIMGAGAPVPEPSTWGILGVGGLLMSWAYGRRRSRE